MARSLYSSSSSLASAGPASGATGTAESVYQSDLKGRNVGLGQSLDLPPMALGSGGEKGWDGASQRKLSHDVTFAASAGSGSSSKQATSTQATEKEIVAMLSNAYTLIQSSVSDRQHPREEPYE